MERVSTYQGLNSVLIVAPNCPDDKNTDIIALEMIKKLRAFGVINRGWKKSMAVDYMNDQADCNSLIHLQEDVVREEFLHPIANFSNRIFKKYPQQTVFLFNIVGHESKDENIDLVLGFGQGQHTSSYTCEEWRKDLFCYLCKKSSINCYGTASATRSKYCLIQLFKQHMKRTYMQAIQIAVVEELRKDKEVAIITGDFLSDIVQKIMMTKSWSNTDHFTVPLLT